MVKHAMLAFLLVTLPIITASSAIAGDTLVQSVMGGCSNERKTYCRDVLPGQGRLLKCLEENDAKVSIRGKQALKDVGTR